MTGDGYADTKRLSAEREAAYVVNDNPGVDGTDLRPREKGISNRCNKAILAGFVLLLMVMAVLVTFVATKASGNTTHGIDGSKPMPSFIADGPAENVCTCTNGIAATGTACALNGAAVCVSCDAGYNLRGASCEEAVRGLIPLHLIVEHHANQDRRKDYKIVEDIICSRNYKSPDHTIASAKVACDADESCGGFQFSRKWYGGVRAQFFDVGASCRKNGDWTGYQKPAE